MKVKYLVYKGSKNQGSLIVKKVSAISPWRVLNYYTGLKLRLDKDIPSNVAKFIVEMQPSLFEIKDSDLNSKESFELLFSELIESFTDLTDENIKLSVEKVLNPSTKKKIKKKA